MSAADRPARRRVVATDETIKVSPPAFDEGNDDHRDQTGEASGQENQNSGQTSGNPETQNSRKTGNKKKENQEEEPFDYLGSTYGGITDPYDDFVKGSTQLPLCLWRALKAAAPMEDCTMQELMRDILLGRRKPLPVLQPQIEQKFYKMAQEGKLKR